MAIEPQRDIAIDAHVQGLYECAATQWPQRADQSFAALARYEDAKRQLAECVRVDEAKAVRDKAVALRVYARQAQDRELLDHATQIKLRAERRCGELLIEMAARGERFLRGRPKRFRQGTFSLAEIGVGKKESARFQKLAALTDQGFDLKLAAARAEIDKSLIATRAERQAEKRDKRAARETELSKEIRALPEKKYGVIYADPEWRFETLSPNGMDRAADNHYPTSDLEAIMARDVGAIAADDCALFLWATAPLLPQGLAVLGAWGFRYKTNFAWAKDRAGTGYWNRQQHELLLLGTRGDVPCPAPGDQWPSLIAAPRASHSQKPVTVCELIESYFPTLPKIELNRRGPPRAGWDAWGNEAETLGHREEAPCAA